MGNEVLVTWLQKEDLWVSNNGCTGEVKYITMQFKKYKIYLSSEVFVIRFFYHSDKKFCPACGRLVTYCAIPSILIYNYCSYASDAIKNSPLFSVLSLITFLIPSFFFLFLLFYSLFFLSSSLHSTLFFTDYTK